MAQKHGEQYGSAGAFSPDAVAASLAGNDGGFGRGQEQYYDHPVLRKPHWRWEIVTYFWAGGMAAGSAALAAIADVFGGGEDAALVRNARYSALVLSGVSGVLLILDLGRPERFLHMLRIVKLKSPMSVGVYAFSSFSTVNGVAALEQLCRDRRVPFDPFARIPAPLRRAVLAVSAALMASYTGVLLSATAIPLWFTGRRHIPPIFVLSAAGSGAALQSLLIALFGGSPRTLKKLETIELIASLGELALLLDFERMSGEIGKPLFAGRRGARLRRYTQILGIAVPALLNLPSVLSSKPARSLHRVRTILTAALALGGGYVLRESVVYAGRESADDGRAYLRHPE